MGHTTDIKSRLIAPSFRYQQNGELGDFDLDAFIKRFLLFDTYIIDSRRLTEIPHLVRVFTLDGLLALIDSGALRINCSFSQTGSKAVTPPNVDSSEKSIYRPHQYKFVTIGPAEINNHVNYLLQQIEPEIQLSDRKTVRLRKAIYSSLEHPNKDICSIEATKNEIVSSPNVLKSAIAIVMHKRLNIQVNREDIEVNVQFDTENDFRVISNIQKLFDIERLTAHQIIERGCLAIAKRNDRIEQMRRYSALAGFSDIDLPIFGERLEFLASALSPDSQEHRFQRIIELTELPQVKNGLSAKIDAKRLLKVRKSIECIEFRQWLTTTDGISDKEILQQVRSLSKTIGRLVGGEAGRNIRFLVTNGIGMVPVVGSAISLTLSTLDHFLLDKIFPRSGVTAFIDDMYPSIFKKVDF